MQFSEATVTAITKHVLNGDIDQLCDGRTIVQDTGLLLYPVASPFGNKLEPYVPIDNTKYDTVHEVSCRMSDKLK